MRFKFKKILIGLTVAFTILNVMAFIHAYKFTHFSQTQSERTKDPKDLAPLTKAKILFTGIDNPKPQAKSSPAFEFNTIRIESDVSLEAWHTIVPEAKGTVIMFHGYSGEKSLLLTRAEQFMKLGYSTLLVDFMGSGGSEGAETSIGFHEAREVKDTFDYLKGTGERTIHLFGTSMGAAAILKCIDDYDIQPASVILECPFGSLYKTVCARFRLMGVPTFPMASLLSFWGGVQQGYWAFSHNPAEYAKSVKCPALLLFGEKDDRVSLEETNNIYENLRGEKVLVTYPEIGHAIFVQENEDNWIRDASSFMAKHP